MFQGSLASLDVDSTKQNILYNNLFLIQGHSHACEHAQIKCTNPNCKMSFKRSRLAEHLKNQCEYRNVKCDYCGKDVTFASMKASEENIYYLKNNFDCTCNTEL